MSVTLHEIDPGVCIVPELVSAVTIAANYDGMSHTGYRIEAHLCGGGTIRVRSRNWFLSEPGRPPVYAAVDWVKYGEPELRELIAWIDARRIEPLAFA